MKTTYTRNINNNYLNVYPECDNERIFSYRDKMLQFNTINHLLPVNTICENDDNVYQYDISGLQSMSTLIEHKKLSYNDLKNIVSSLKGLLVDVDRYLLDANNIMLNPEYIFCDYTSCISYFVYCPAFSSDFSNQFRDFFCFILNHIDHEDKECVLSAYSIQQASQKDGFSYINVLDSTPLAACDSAKKVEERPLTVPSPAYKEEILKPTFSYSEFMRIAKIPISILISLVIYSVLHINLHILPSKIAFLICFIHIIALIYYSVRLYQRKDEYIFSTLSAITSSSTNKADILASIPEPSEKVQNTVLLYSSPKEKKCRLLYSGQENFEDISISNFPFTLGKIDDSVDCVVDSPSISRIHARFTHTDDRYYIEDLNSTNGTYVNDVALSPYLPSPISSGDHIEIAKNTYIFVAS